LSNLDLWLRFEQISEFDFRTW